MNTSLVKTSSLLALLALLLAGCGGSDAVAATVDGTEISMAEVRELRAGDAGSVPRETFNEDLRNAIVEAAVVQAAEEQFGISVTDEQVDARLEELRRQIEQQGSGSYEEFLEQQGFSDERIRRIAHQQLVSEAVLERVSADAADVTGEDVQAEYDRQVLGRTQACLQHVLVETEEEAQDVRERLEAGEDLAAVAGDVSIDPSAETNEGDLGCAPLSQYVTEFAQAAFDAEIGEVVGPVESQFGYHVLVVESRETPELGEVEEEITGQLEQARTDEAFRQWLLEVVQAAEVEVDPELGRWASDPVPQILPPQ